MNDALIDVALCDQEPIHVPGSIQPHGVMLVAEEATQRIRYVAGDVEGRLGLASWDGVTLEQVLGGRLYAAMAQRLDGAMQGGFIGQHVAAGNQICDVTAHRSQAWIVVELEPAAAEVLPAAEILGGLEAAVAGFERAGSVIALCERAAAEYRRITGFDRVMIYRFLDDHAGRVLAEDRGPDLQPFLNHHFPASDIPRQARALYLRNPMRVIPDAGYRPAPLRPAWAHAAPLDMGDSVLRSVSAIHLQYLRNMGVQASASVSIILDGALWGLVACHHATPRAISYDVRATCRALAGGLARQLRAKDEAEGYRQRLRLRSAEDDILALLAREGSLDGALSNHLPEIGRMLGGDGVAVLRGHELVTGGICPDPTQLRRLIGWMQQQGGDAIFASANLSAVYAPAADFMPSGSGVLAVTVSTDEPWVLMWFRVEHVEVVEWAGNPHKPLGGEALGELTPRGSFAAWRETVRGYARPWSAPEIEAARHLRIGLVDIRQRRRVQELNRHLTELVGEKESLLQQKEFLIGEVNHRVQNSLQLVGSFLALQGRGSNDASLHAALAEAQSRLNAVALVHRRLYRGDQIELVDAARYVEELCAETIASMGREWARYLSLDLAQVMISTDRAVTLGLVLTELMININKYAYGGGPGPVEIALVADTAAFRLSVTDQGVGRVSARKGFGSRMMEGLVKQLGGTILYEDNRPGVRAVVTVPVQAEP